MTNNSPDWIRWYPSRWLSGVLNLTNEQRGVYIQIINVILDLGECPSDPKYIGRLCNLRSHCARRVVGELVALGKLIETGAKLHQNRAETEMKRARNLTETQRLKATKRWKNNGLGHAAAPCHIREEENKKESHRLVPTESSSVESEHINIVHRSQNGTIDGLSIDAIDGRSHDGSATKERHVYRFDDWWACWDIPGTKRGRASAERKYRTVIKADRASHDELCEGVERYMTWCRRERQEVQYIKHPETWLNQGCWEDELFNGRANGVRPNNSFRL